MLKLNKNTVKVTKKIIIIYLLLIPLIYFLVTNARLARYNTDVCQDYESAVNLLSGKSIYLPNKCWGYRTIPLHLNPHPPFAIFPFLLLTTVPIEQANIVWGLFSAAFFALSLVLILIALKIFNLPNFAIFLALSIFWDPLRNSTINQNTSQLMLLLLASVWYLDLNKRQRAAGILLGISTLLRFWPAVYLVFALLSKRYKLVASSALTILSGFIITLFTNGLSDYAVYINTVLRDESLQVLNPDNVSLVSLAVKIIFRSGLDTYRSIYTGKAIGLLVFIFISCITGLIARKKLHNQEVYTLIQSISLNMLIFVFPIYWGWGLLIYLLIYAMVSYSLKSFKTMPKLWRFLFFTSVIMLFVLKIFVERYPPSDPQITTLEYMKMIDVHTLISLLGAFTLMGAQIWLLILHKETKD